LRGFIVVQKGKKNFERRILGRDKAEGEERAVLVRCWENRFGGCGGGGERSKCLSLLSKTTITVLKGKFLKKAANEWSSPKIRWYQTR